MYSGTACLAFCGTGNGLGVGRGIGDGDGGGGGGKHLDIHSENVVQFSLPVSV